MHRQEVVCRHGCSGIPSLARSTVGNLLDVEDLPCYWGHVLFLVSRSICQSTNRRLVQPQPLCYRSLAKPIQMDRLDNRGIPRDLRTLSVKQCLELRPAHISLVARDLRYLLRALHVPLECLDKVCFSQQHLCVYALPNRRPVDSFSDKSPVVPGGRLSLLTKLT